MTQMFLTLAETRKLQVLKFCIFQVSGLHRKQKIVILKIIIANKISSSVNLIILSLITCQAWHLESKIAYLDSWSIFSIVL